MFILDTNVISEIRKPSADLNVLSWFRPRSPSDFYLTAIVVFELEMAVRRVERRDERQGRRLRRWMDEEVLDLFRGRILELDCDVALRSASLQVPDPRPERDCFIGATALVHGMTVATRNVKDFERMGVPVINPWSE